MREIRRHNNASTVCWLLLLLCCCGGTTTARLSSEASRLYHYGRIHSQVITNIVSCRGGGGGGQTSTISSSNPFSAKFVPSNTKKPNNNQLSRSTTTTSTPTYTYNNKQKDEEEKINAAKEQMDAFLTRDSRNGFIGRVYAILAGQLLITAASIFLFGTHPEWTAYMLRPGFGAVLPAMSLLLSTVAWVVMSLSTTARRSSPMKWQILALFTLGEAMSVGFVTSFYELKSVISTMLVTALATIGVSLYTIFQRNPKFDLSQWGSSLSSFCLIFFFYGMTQILELMGILPAGFIPFNEKLYGLFGATLFSCYLAYHTKLITAGKSAKYQMNEKDYIYGAMTLYNDIINVFIYMLKLMGDERKHGKDH